MNIYTRIIVFGYLGTSVAIVSMMILLKTLDSFLTLLLAFIMGALTATALVVPTVVKKINERKIERTTYVPGRAWESIDQFWERTGTTPAWDTIRVLTANHKKDRDASADQETNKGRSHISPYKNDPLYKWFCQKYPRVHNPNVDYNKYTIEQLVKCSNNHGYRVLVNGAGVTPDLIMEDVFCPTCHEPARLWSSVSGHSAGIFNASTQRL